MAPSLCVRYAILVGLILVQCRPLLAVDPVVLLHHSFDESIAKVTRSKSPVSIKSGKDLGIRQPAIRGKAAWFAQSDHEASLRIELGDLVQKDAWTIALWEIIEVKEWLSAPEESLLTLLDGDNRPLVKLSKSGGVFVYEDDKEIHLDCFDALYWVRGSREHLTLTYDSHGSGLASPSGILRAYWKARPYASLAIDLDRRPAAIEIGQPSAGLGVDDLFVLDRALSLRSIWELMQFDGGDLVALEKSLGQRETIEAKRPTAVRRTAWEKLAKTAELIEAESNPGKGKTITCPEKTKKAGRFDATNNAATASGRQCVAPRREPMTFKFKVDKTTSGFSFGLRYCLDRKMHSLWPQDSDAHTPWSENYAEVDVKLNGRISLGTIKLYPTGTYSGHHGDVDMWAWKQLGSGEAILLEGDQSLTFTLKKGLAEPIYDALLVLRDEQTVLKPPHPRWVDQYRIPPSWWVLNHNRTIEGVRRIDVYGVRLKNRCDEPCSYEILIGNEKLKKQTASVSHNKVSLAPHESKDILVRFESPASLENNSEWANIYLWNDDVALRQKYRLWNLIPPKSAAKTQHPVLTDPPDPELQVALRKWLVSRDPEKLTPELKNWTRRRYYAIADGSPVFGFPSALTSERLAALDAWMKMSEDDIERYLPDGPAEFNGYGSGWDRTGVEYAGVWHKMPKVASISPPGDIDNVTSLTVSAPPQKGKTDDYKKTYDNDQDLINCVRDTRWITMMGHKFYGAAPHGDALGRVPHSGITLLAEAYYLTGDKRYARKAYEMMRVFARKYTHLTKHFNYVVNREDRDWWGGRIGGRYLMKFGPRYYHAMGIYVLDLIWDGLTPQERTVIEHNVVRWGMYEGMSGPLFEVPEYFAAVNKEDMPFLAMGRVLGDPAPIDGLNFFYDVYRDVVLPDGIHKCSLGSYGGVNSYTAFLKKLSDHGLDVSRDPALRKLFSAHPSFIFSGGGFPNIDDGGGVNINGLGAGFGCPSKEQYEWAKQFYADPSLDEWPKLIAAAQRVNSAPPEKKAETIKKEFTENESLVNQLWPPLYVAPVKGLAILRNRTATEPIDWKEVIFDYGLMGGRSHGHAAKLATIPSFNGQIVSMEYGYGMLQPVGSGFHTRSYAHNVVIADGRSQFSSGAAVPVGEFRESHSDPKVQWIDADSTRIYDGIYMRRTVFTTDFGIVDLYLCQSDKPHKYEWMYHSFGVARTELPLRQFNLFAKSGPLSFARNPRGNKTHEAIQVVWENKPRTKPAKKESTALLHEKAYVRLWSAPAKDTTLALFGIEMTEAVGGEIDYAMLRRNSKSTVFANIQEPWRESTGPAIVAIRQIPVREDGKIVADEDAYALEVTRSGGTRSVYFVNYSDTPKKIGKVTTNANVATWDIPRDGSIQAPKATAGKRFIVD